MNTVITSREAILAVCREFVAQTGLQALNIRDIAAECGISVGAVYHYFPSKESLVAAAIEEIWHSIFHLSDGTQSSGSFVEYVEVLFRDAQRGVREYPNFFTMHALAFTSTEKAEARRKMEFYFEHMKKGLLTVLKEDKKVGANIFSTDFSAEGFADFVFTSFLSLLTQGSGCEMLLEVIRRILYENGKGEFCDAGNHGNPV